jgi:hypothetical protein
MLDDGHEVFKALVEATGDVENEDSVVDRRPTRASAMPLNLRQYSVTERSPYTNLRIVASR